MIRQIGPHYQEPQMTMLEDRLHQLEAKVATLTEAVRTLARALEDGPMAEPDGTRVSDAARRAYDLLLAGQQPPPGAGAAPR